MKSTTIEIKNIEKAPLHGINVSVTVAKNVELLKTAVKNERYPEPILASYGGKLYPVGNIDTLEAARAVGTRKLICRVEEANSVEAVAKQHIFHSRSRTYNPASLMSMLRLIEENNGDMEGIPTDLKKFSSLDISDDAKKTIDRFVKDMGRKRMEVPSIMHLMSPLSKVEKRKQPQAMEDIIKHSTFNGTFIPPDLNIVSRMLDKYPKNGPTSKDDEEEMIIVQPEPKEEIDDVPDDFDNVDVNIKKSIRDMGTEMTCNKNVVKFESPPHINTKTYLVDFKNSKIKELKEGGSNITAIEMIPDPLYAVDDRVASFLELDMSPIIYNYNLGGKKTGDVSILSKRRISKKDQGEIAKILNCGGR